VFAGFRWDNKTRDHRDMTQHREVQVKVNAFVDEGIADLIGALSDVVPGLVTLESCQGGDGQDAFVFFRMPDWRETGEFLFDRLLPTLSPDLRGVVALRIQAYDTRVARGSITLDPRAISLLAECVRSLAATVGPRSFIS
jgi:hypothetical protein